MRLWKRGHACPSSSNGAWSSLFTQVKEQKVMHYRKSQSSLKLEALLHMTVVRGLDKGSY